MTTPSESPKPLRMAAIQRRLLEILALLLVAIPLCGVLVLYEQAGQLIYYRYGKARWSQLRPGTCSPSRKALVFADMRSAPPAKGRQQPPLELSCEAAQQLPAQSAYATAPDGLRLHYRVWDAPPGRPLLLHVPGLTSTWLDAARYVKPAERMGFQLATLELRNHGISGNDGRGAGYGCREGADLVAVVKALVRDQPARPLYIWGSSMGSMTLLNAQGLKAAAPGWRAAVLENPPSSMRARLQEATPGYPGLVYDALLGMASWRSGLDLTRCAPVKLAPDFPVPALVTVSAQDSMTPPAMAEAVYRALPRGRGSHYQIYPQGAHAAIWNGQPQRYEADLKAFWEAQRPAP
ncbi:MAG: alpha/beta hydrolase [Candidatus Sericytochromatia bacterium]